MIGQSYEPLLDKPVGNSINLRRTAQSRFANAPRWIACHEAQDNLAVVAQAGIGAMLGSIAQDTTFTFGQTLPHPNHLLLDTHEELLSHSVRET
jgi:hypothetical protein